ncbi:MAG: phosphotransferase [Chloroflexi bacterium]|nr:phosphotransferase [Chloroflexota bacterium]MCC6895350.1 phosphotransferase [Anaerolineae bacterium]
MPPAYIHFLLIPHPSENQILMLSDETGQRLPHFETAEPHYWQTVAPVTQKVSEHLGIRLATLRCMKTEFANDNITLFYAIDGSLIPADWQPPQGMTWVEQDAVGELPPEQKAVVEEWFQWKADVDAIRTEWYRPGWFAKTTAWIEQQFDERGILLTVPIEQVRSWERSAILRAQTSFGTIYFKALPGMFRHEAPLVKWLAYNDPELFPKPILVDGWRRWLLMPDYGSQTLESVTEIERWEAALRRFAELQISLSVRINELIGLGCPDRRLYTLSSAIEPLLMSSAGSLSGSGLKLTDEELEQLRARIPEFQQACSALGNYGIPASLEHGDFWAGQVVVNGDKTVFIDWSDSSISHPFFSLYFLNDADAKLPDAPNVRERLRDAYLQPWRAYEPLDKLIEAFDLAMLLAPLHHALIYQRHILPQMQVQWEMNNMIAFYLRSLLPK